MVHAHIDFETRSEADLIKAGSDYYAQHVSTDILCMAYAIGDEPVALWVPGEPLPECLMKHIADGGKVIGHNIGGFEMLIWNCVGTLKYGFPQLKIEQCECTMAMAYAMALPGSLNDSSLALGIEYKKDMKGHRVMLQLCKPRDAEAGTWWEKEDYPEKYEQLYSYCKQDVEVERELYRRLMKLNPREQKLWELDYTINRRGVYVDKTSAVAAMAVVDAEKERLDLEMTRVTGGLVQTCSEVARLTQWLKERGLDVDGVAKNDILELLDSEIPEDCRHALMLRQEAAKTSTAKLKSMILGASLFSRARGMFQYHGASTGRWAGRRIQLQNLPRPKISQEKMDEFFEFISYGESPRLTADKVSAFIGPPMSVVSDSIRGFIRAAPGYDLIACDFSSIEARVLAWLANQRDLLQLFREGGKIYEHAAAGIYRVLPDEVTADQRQIGKVAILALGYGGGVGAFKTMAKGYGVRVSDDEATAIKDAWRLANSDIVDYWKAIEFSAMYATSNPGKKCEIRDVTFLKNGSFLWCRLPSKRVLCYPYPKIEPVETPWGQMRDSLTYMSVDAVTNNWVRTKTYGGKLVENITQAVARDVLAEGIFALEAKGYPVVLHVHDETVSEVPIGFGSLKEVERILSYLDIPWAEGLPLKAKGWRGIRYRKD